MKTFKAVRFQIVNDEQITEYELLDGIIINKENKLFVVFNFWEKKKNVQFIRNIINE